MSIRLKPLAKHLRRRFACVHRDEQGAISILTVFVMLIFMWLLMMIVNVARQLDDKVRMQNGVDAATYSGSVVLARGMNAIAFSNHLEADVFAITAFLREASNREAESYVPEILAAWREAGSVFSRSTFPKFVPLTQAINNKIPLEQQFVTAWGEMAAAAADEALPVYEYILGTPETIDPDARDHLIPEFQRAVLHSTPDLAQEVMKEMALRHGLREDDLQSLSQGQLRFQSPGAAIFGSRQGQTGVLWSTSVEPVAGDQWDPWTRTLPVIDPALESPYGAYLQEAQERREWLARLYLNDWISDRNPLLGLEFADEEARMSQYARLFHAAACIQLDKLLNEEYPKTNLPFILRDFVGIDLAGLPEEERRLLPPPDFVTEITEERLINEFTFVGVAYRRHVDLKAPRLFSNPIDEVADAQTFAQARLYIPRRRFYCCPWGVPVRNESGNQVYDQFGNPIRHPNTDNWNFDWRQRNPWRNRRMYQKYAWSTFNQNWTVKLVPATAESIPEILSSNKGGHGMRTPNLGGLSSDSFQTLNTH